MHNGLNFNKKNLIDNVKLLIDKSVPLVSNLANLSRLIIDSLDNVSWCGFYMLNNENQSLYLGPYQGSIACTSIPYGKGVCGKAVELMQSQIVANVHTYDGHIACSSLTNSELVVPIIKNNICYGVLDLDSNEFNNFSYDDQLLLEEVCLIISELI